MVLLCVNYLIYLSVFCLQILKYQGKFKQAKVNTISKLVHKLKEPEKITKKVKNPEAKLERYKNVLDYLKVKNRNYFIYHTSIGDTEIVLYLLFFKQHTSPKRLGLLALHYYKSGKNYLADQDSTVEQLAIGYYSESKNLNVVLDALREQLHIERNDKWKKATRKLFKKNETAEVQVSKAKDAGDESMETDSVVDKDVMKVKNKLKKGKNQEETTFDTEKQKKTKSKNAKTKFNDDKNDLDETNTTEAPETVDDFFITADGSNYLSNAVVNSAQKDDDTESKPFPAKKQSHEFVMNGGIGAGSSGRKFERNSGPKRFAGEKRKWNDANNDPVEVKEERKIDPNLHPSWIAKQKQKPTITEFKGTKITFD